MAPRSRILAFGSAAALVVAGALCAAFAGGVTGEVLAVALMSTGAGGAVLLGFLEVGLSEDRELARSQERRRRRARRSLGARGRPWPPRRPRRPGHGGRDTPRGTR
jgi:hypothetical protein